MDLQIDLQIDLQMDLQIDLQMDLQIDLQINLQMVLLIDLQMDLQLDIQMVIDGSLDGPPDSVLISKNCRVYYTPWSQVILEDFGGLWRSLEEYFGIFEVRRSALCKSPVKCGELWNVKSNLEYF